MKPQFKKILEELYELNPELQAKETELLQILMEMVSHRPDATFDEAFKSELKQKVLHEIQSEKYSARSQSNWKNILIGFIVGSGSIALASFAVFQVISPVAQVNTPAQTPASTTVAVTPINFGFTADVKPNGAFGALRQADTQAAPSKSTAFSAQSNAGGRMMATAVPPAASTPESAKTEPAAVNSKMAATMPYFEQKVYNYVYSGTGYAFKDKELSVYLKNKTGINASEAASLLSGFKLSNIDVSKFSNLLVNNISISEDKQNGLMLSLDFNEGTLYITKNWTKWTLPNCLDEACYTANATKLSDIPADSKVLDTVAKFIKDYKIDVTSYGKPYVNNDWKTQYDEAKDKTTAYIPDSVTVVYPLTIDGKIIYEEYGQARGITVTVDVKTGLVSDVSGIEKLNFSASKYTVETDFKKILEIASKGGRTQAHYPMPASTEENKVTTVNVSLGEPTLIYTHIYEYKDGKSSEYIVPALSFPVTQKPKEGEYFQDKIIVPVIKDFYEMKNPPIMYKE